MASLVTMSDIARIANVTRQAVTNWRSRPASLAFPSVQETAGGVERFDRDEILDWLEATGRGLNDDARLDAPAVAVADDLNVDEAVVMLALRANVTQDLTPLSTDERVALAQEVDADDRYLLTEVAALAANDELAEFIDSLVEASYGASDALDRLYASRVAQGSRGLASEAVALVQQLADACRTFLGPDGVAVELSLDPRDRRVASGFEAAGSQSERATLRLHAIDGVHVETAVGPLVKVVSVAGLGDAEALDVAGDVAVGLDSDQVAIVIGPASALCDRLVGELYNARRSSLEMGALEFGCALVASFRLPRGLWREAHRQSLGLWVLHGEATVTGAVVADLSGMPISGAELAADVLGALEQTGARAYRYGRVLPYSAVWTGDTVVPAGMVAQPTVALDSKTAYDRLVGSTLVTREPIVGFDLPGVAKGTPVPAAAGSLGELVDTRVVRLQSGSRISTEDMDPGGSVRILDAHGGGPHWIDRLVAASRYSAAALTEPGDVVFSTNPPQAIVDEIGGAIVASPSRILRPDPMRAGIGPRALAAVINQFQDNSEWKAWPIPRLPGEHVQRIEDALAEVADHVATLRKHEAAAADLVASLIKGVAAGSVTLDAPKTEQKAG